MSTFALIQADIKLQLSYGRRWAALVLFFIIVLLLLPFAIGPDPDLLRRLAPGLIWLAALLTNLQALDDLFAADARDGTLDVMLLAVRPLPLAVLSKLLAQIAVTLLALFLLLMPAALMLNLDNHVLPVLALTFLLGVPSLTLLGGIASALTLGLRRNPALLTLLLAPFYIPVLIFAVAAVDATALGVSPLPHLCLLAAVLAILLPAAPLTIAAALRHAQS
jgi:heme exporter protein B